MGQRTQMIVGINVIDANNEMIEEQYAAFHYQWGFGRAMPMSALDVVTKLEGFTLLTLGLDKYASLTEIANRIKDEIIPLASPDLKMDLLADKSPVQKQGAYLLPENQDFDNNDGFATLSIAFVRNGAELAYYDGELNFFTTSGRPITFDDWCKSYSRFITNDWQVGYTRLLKSYHITIG